MCKWGINEAELWEGQFWPKIRNVLWGGTNQASAIDDNDDDEQMQHLPSYGAYWKMSWVETDHIVIQPQT